MSLGIVALAGCGEDTSAGTAPTPAFTTARADSAISPLPADMNRRLAKARKKFRVSHAEYVTTDVSGQAGRKRRPREGARLSARPRPS